MKILFFDFQIPDLLLDGGKTTGGASVRIHHLASGLGERGNEVGILTWKGCKNLINQKLKYELIETYPPKGGIRYVRKIYFNFYLTFIAAKKFKPDFIFTKGNSINSGIMAIIARLLDVRLGYIVTNNKDTDDRAYEEGSKISHYLFEYSLIKSNIAICQNKYQHDRLRIRFPTKKLIIIQNPYPIEKILNTCPDRDKRKYIAWVGVFSKQKNLPGLLKIVENLPDYQFKIAGSVPSGTMIKDGKKLDNQSEEAIRKLGLCSNVEFVGFIKRRDIIEFLSLAVLLLNTSHYEGFSNTFLEAFAAGTPVVTRRDIDPDGIIFENKIGQSVERDDSFPEAIRNLFNADDYNSISNRCRSYLRKNHDLNMISQKLEEAIYDPVSQS